MTALHVYRVGLVLYGIAGRVLDWSWLDDAYRRMGLTEWDIYTARRTR